MIRRALLALFLAPASPASAGSTSAETLDAINATCVPAEEMALAGIRLGDARALVDSRLGNPVHRAVEGAKDVLEYEGLRVRLHASRVQRVLSTASTRSTPSGLRPGLFAEQVNEILGFELDSIASPHSRSPSHYQIHRCVAEDEQIDVEQYLRLELSPDRAIATGQATVRHQVGATHPLLVHGRGSAIHARTGPHSRRLLAVPLRGSLAWPSRMRARDEERA
jgi:hypothetical protein